MGLSGAKLKGYIRIRGRPREQARAEIMLMRQREGYENRKRRQMFFTFLDIIAILGFLVGIFSIYKGNLLNGILSISLGIIILLYFIIRNMIRKKKNIGK